MILFVFEGKKTEPSIVDTMFRLYPELCNDDPEKILCSFGTDIHTLYKRIKELGGEVDIVRVLKEERRNDKTNDIHKIEKSDDVSHIYLFFDYDFQCTLGNLKLNLSTYHQELKEMLAHFNNETDGGKLYISYPMVEALMDDRGKACLCFKASLYFISQEVCRNSYKSDVAGLGLFNKLVVQAGKSGKIKANKLKTIKKIWLGLIKLNLCRAMALCQGQWRLPTSLDEVEQKLIYDKQYAYVQGAEPQVCVLSPFPLFILEYFGIEGTKALLSKEKKEVLTLSFFVSIILTRVRYKFKGLRRLFSELLR